VLYLVSQSTQLEMYKYKFIRAVFLTKSIMQREGELHLVFADLAKDPDFASYAPFNISYSRK
jgi:hypothetical protein